MHHRRGFTFLEILISMLILSILSGVVGLSLYHYVRKARLEKARMQIKIFQAALENYRIDQGQFPVQAQGLDALCVKPAIPPLPVRDYPEEGYLQRRTLPKDPWEGDYLYLAPGQKGEPYEILCYGSDHEPGGTGEAADISSSEL